MSRLQKQPRTSHPSLSLVPLILLMLALADLHIDLRLLLDHFTFASLFAAIRHHNLAVVVLLLQRSLWHRYHHWTS